jgi:phosphatidylinositol glycan class B
MSDKNELPLKWIYITAMIVFFLTAWFSVGYNHYDEHFQIMEFAGLKLGLTEKANLPWEYTCMMRPALQPLIVVLVYKTFAVIGITNPFIIAFSLRLLTAILAFVSIHMVIKVYKPMITSRKLFYALLMLSFFLWFVPYNSVRFSSETVSGRVFLIGLAWFLLRKQPKLLDYLIAGILMGISFIIRYQIACMILGFAAWLIFRKTGFRNLFIFVTGIMIIIALGVVIDSWFYDKWVLTSWNYFQQNILLNKAANFGTSPWWYYIEQTFLKAFPPISVIYILSVFIYFIIYPKSVLTWTIIPFLAIHFLIPHKELRFMYPLIGFLPVMMIESVNYLMKHKGYELLEHSVTKVSVKVLWYLNLGMLVFLIFRPADNQISMYESIWDNYKTPVKLCFTNDNPYQKAGLYLNFYKRKCVLFQQVDSVQKIKLAKDTVTLFYTTKSLLKVNEQLSPVMVYSYFPPWMNHFNINHWMERTSKWFVYELKPIP